MAANKTFCTKKPCLGSNNVQIMPTFLGNEVQILAIDIYHDKRPCNIVFVGNGGGSKCAQNY